MHRRTYERLCNEAAEAQLPYQDRLLKGLSGLLARLGELPQTETDHPDEDQLAQALQRVLESPEPLKQTKRARSRRRTKNSQSPGAPRRRGKK